MIQMDAHESALQHPSFIHLRVHSAYSLLEGALKIDKIVQFAQNQKMPALAITDCNNLFGIFEFSQKAVKAGVQPIIGCEVLVDGSAFDSASAHKMRPLVLLAQDQQGYQNLLHLVSQMYLDEEVKKNGVSHIKLAWLAERSSGLIALTGGAESLFNYIVQMGKQSVLDSYLSFLQKHFPQRLYIELQRFSGYDQAVEKKLLELAYAHDLPLVATNSAYFLEQEDHLAQDALLAIADGQILSNSDRRRLTPDHYLKSIAEMEALFSDIPESLANSVEIARRCSVYTQTHAPILPRFVEKKNEQDDLLQLEAEELSQQARIGLENRLKTLGLAEGYQRQDYEERLEYELSIIIRMQFSGYFLIVSDFIKWAKKHKIAVGPGRGSGAGSLVAYALTITNIDPLRFSLLFERFLNPDRVSMPDFDIDFCQHRRAEVIQYVQNRYGYDHVAQIITFGSLQARGVLRDVGRVLEMPYGQVDRLSKLIPQNPAHPISLEQAVREEPAFAREKEADEKVGQLIEIAQKLEGLYRHASTHAAGIVIGDRPLSELVPMYSDPRSEMPVTQFNMKYVEQAGLVKFDFLGLKTLTVLQSAVELIQQKSITIDIDQIPLDDRKTYKMLTQGDTVGVFQIESVGMRKALMGMKPDCIEDIIALVALYRPGPMENIPVYNDRKNGREAIVSIHPKIDYLLKETQGVIVYQEQVMQIAQVLSGYSLGEADLLRRAMGKKIRAEMDKQRERFVQGAEAGGVELKQAHAIFDLLAKFADYGFNKSHAAAYAYISYQTAYLKAHHPAEFLAASMTHDMSNIDRLNDFRQDAQRLGIEVVAPSIQTSDINFAVRDGRIFYALSAIKGVGEAAAEYLVSCRGDQPFLDLNDFCARVDARMINKRALESLICSGAFDCFQIDRTQLVAAIETLQARSIREHEGRSHGQTSLFDLQQAVREDLILPKVKMWPLSEKLQKEFQVLGFYLSSHPLSLHHALLQTRGVMSYHEFLQSQKIRATLAGTVIARQERKTKTGNKMATVYLSDQSSQYEAVLFSEGLDKYRSLLEAGNSLLFEMYGSRNKETDSFDLRIESIAPLVSTSYRQIKIFLQQSQSLAEIKNCLQSEGKTKIVLVLDKSTIEDHIFKNVEIELSQTYYIDMEHIDHLRTLQGVVTVQFS